MEPERDRYSSAAKLANDNFPTIADDEDDDEFDDIPIGQMLILDVNSATCTVPGAPGILLPPPSVLFGGEGVEDFMMANHMLCFQTVVKNAVARAQEEILNRSAKQQSSEVPPASTATSVPKPVTKAPEPKISSTPCATPSTPSGPSQVAPKKLSPTSQILLKSLSIHKPSLPNAASNVSSGLSTVPEVASIDKPSLPNSAAESSSGVSLVAEVVSGCPTELLTPCDTPAVVRVAEEAQKTPKSAASATTQQRRVVTRADRRKTPEEEPTSAPVTVTQPRRLVTRAERRKIPEPEPSPVPVTATQPRRLVTRAERRKSPQPEPTRKPVTSTRQRRAGIATRAEPRKIPEPESRRKRAVSQSSVRNLETVEAQPAAPQKKKSKRSGSPDGDFHCSARGVSPMKTRHSERVYRKALGNPEWDDELGIGLDDDQNQKKAWHRPRSFAETILEHKFHGRNVLFKVLRSSGNPEWLDDKQVSAGLVLEYLTEKNLTEADITPKPRPRTRTSKRQSDSEQTAEGT